jgi:hypothetical protein
MGVCIFTASGLNFDVDGFLRGSSLKPFTVYHQGESPKAGNILFRPQEEPGFMVLVSHDDKPNLVEQGLAALDFIAANNQEFEHLREVGAEKVLLHFGLAKHQIAKRPQYLPPELLLAMGRLGIGLVFATVDLGKG